MTAVIAITGASRGIGFKLCKHFCDQGNMVVGLSRGSSDFHHEKYVHIQADITDEVDVKEALQQIGTNMGRLDVLVNNAGVLTSQYAMLIPGAAAEQMLKTNVFGSFLMSRECAKLMMKRKWGRIISMSSMAVPLSPAGDAMYAASKSALNQFTQIFAKEVAGYGITCNVLGISAIETEMMKKIPVEKLKAILKQLPIQREITVGDITNALDFFIKTESAAITAQILYLGGVF